eukprot:424885-Prymnesium_polylepis.1
MGGAAAAAGAGAYQQQQQQQQQQRKARARSAVVRARRLVCWPGACARAWNLSPAQQPQRMPLSTWPKQLSNVLDPA